MGIKFLCPNGHKLNVKSFLSGKKAICPKCGIKVLVPSDSVAADDSIAPDVAMPTTAGQSSPQAGAGHFGPASFPAVDPQRTLTGAPQTHDGGMPASPAATVYPAMSPASVSPGMPGAGMPSHAAPFSPAALQSSPTRDAIDEAPAAVWYVRPPTGGQFGPAAADMMRTWLADGRVTANSLVWRSGWPQWLSAQTAFPQLAGATVAAPLPQAATAPAYSGATGYPAMPGYGQAPAMHAAPNAMHAAPYGAATVPAGQIVGAIPLGGYADPSDSAPRPRRRRKSNDTTMIVSAILIVLTLVLVVILVVVLTREAQQPAADPGAGKTEYRIKKINAPPAKPKANEEDF